jgi:hypothetical protein
MLHFHCRPQYTQINSLSISDRERAISTEVEVELERWKMYHAHLGRGSVADDPRRMRTHAMPGGATIER